LGFITHSNQVRLTEATFSADADFGHIGFRVDGGAGDFYKNAMAADSWKGVNQYVSQAFLVWKPTRATRIEAGKFFSSVGAEVAESYQNFNTTRSLLFWYAEPLYHAGVRSSMAIGEHLSTGVQLLSGCNTITGARGRQTVALTTNWSGKRWGWSEIYLDGNVKTEGSGRRRLSDTVLTFNPSRTITGYAEAVAAVEKRVGNGYDRWYGFASAWKISPRKKWSFSPRWDWLNDLDGATTSLPQRLWEFTVTGEYRPHKLVTTRLEYRSDFSDRPFYLRGANSTPTHHQQTLLAGILFVFQREL
jgi:hypothetical protein